MEYWTRLGSAVAVPGGNFGIQGGSVVCPESSEKAPVPLWRGHGMHVRFTGLE